MNQAEFDENFARLTPTQERVLKLFMAHNSDQDIAKALGGIREGTIRKHIEAICNKMGIEAPPQTSRRPQLLALVAKYKPELLGNSTPTVVNPSEELPTEADELDCVEEAETFNREFLGRGPAMAELDEHLRNGAKAVLIWAGGGIGKTTLAREFFKARDFELVLELDMAKETQGITPVESVVEDWFKKDLQQESGREFGVSLRRLKEHLKTHRIGIFIDNLEPALANGLFIEPHRQYVELLRVLTDPTVQSVTLITSRERLCEAGVSIEPFHLQGLDKQAWKQYFTSRKMAIDTSVLEQMHHAYGGNAEAMKILCGAIREDYGGDMAAYWRDNDGDLLVHRELEDLVTRQFKRLEGQNPQAYRLLCRMGCFRYQDVPRVPRKALLDLLWDVSENPGRIIRALHDRALIECEKGEYWLHPVIRAEAIARLRSGEDWEKANREAAEFWTGGVDTVETIEQALTAFEAYYHYVQIEDFEQAGSVIVKRRKNQWDDWETGEPLGVSFQRLGMAKKIKFKINSILNKVQDAYCLLLLYNILAAFESILGNLHQAIKLNKMAEFTATKISFPNLEIQSLALASMFNQGLCKIDLGEFEEALNIFEKARTIFLNTHFKLKLKPYPEFYLKTIFYVQHEKKLDITVEEAKILENSQILESAWSKGYYFIFCGKAYNNLKQYEKSYHNYQQAIKYATISNYTQVKAIALTGLAELERKHKNFITALSHHEASIKILDDIGAKCDLAEAYYQQGLTYQEMGKTEKSEESFDEAIRLFRAIEAPKQVEKVRKAIEKVG